MAIIINWKKSNILFFISFFLCGSDPIKKFNLLPVIKNQLSVITAFIPTVNCSIMAGNMLIRRTKITKITKILFHTQLYLFQILVNPWYNFMFLNLASFTIWQMALRKYYSMQDIACWSFWCIAVFEHNGISQWRAPKNKEQLCFKMLFTYDAHIFKKPKQLMCE